MPDAQIVVLNQLARFIEDKVSHLLLEREATTLRQSIATISQLVARPKLQSIVSQFQVSILKMNFDPIHRMLELPLTNHQSKPDEDTVFKLISTTKETIMSHMERAVVQQLSFLNQVVAQKKEQLKRVSFMPVNRIKKSLTLTENLMDIYNKERQTTKVYNLKIDLRERIYLLLSQEMEESIDLFMIGSSQTGMGSKTCDNDLCLVIYGHDKQIDPKYDEKEAVLTKLEQLRQILERNNIASKLMVIPALVPILKFTETKTGIEVNLNINKVMTIRNTHLMHAYSQLDPRVAQLVLVMKIWAEKKGIKSAFNKSLTSYSISLMVIHFLQKGCSPPVVPCLQGEFPHLFGKEAIHLRLIELNLPVVQNNSQDLGSLFMAFFDYYTRFDFNKVISVRTGSLLDREMLIGRYDGNESHAEERDQRERPKDNGKLWQWKCHICIEEPFTLTNTSHAVHDCLMYRQIIQNLIDTYILLVNGCFTL